MHEGNFTEQIVESILSELRKYPEGKPVRVKVRIGEVFHLDPESVRFHFANLVQGTDLESAELVLEEVNLVVSCRVCQEIRKFEDHHLLICPACGSRDVQVVSGDEVLIEEIQFAGS